MYIREDLLNKLKELYDTKNFTYIGIEKNIFEKPILYKTCRKIIKNFKSLYKISFYFL